ncbi:MAG: hypothetical protein H7Y37_15225 [Anaerolineae bacterium]|nr:hypothetical protein [Gloeobacterales cyanobacterium ES-bin-313]
MLQVSKVFAKNDYPTLLLMILPMVAFILLSFFSPLQFLLMVGTVALIATAYRFAALWAARREANQIALVRQQLITYWHSYKEIGS